METHVWPTPGEGLELLGLRFVHLLSCLDLYFLRVT